MLPYLSKNYSNPKFLFLMKRSNCVKYQQDYVKKRFLLIILYYLQEANIGTQLYAVSQKDYTKLQKSVKHT